MSVNDQWIMSRLPIKVLPYSYKELANCNEIIIDYLGDDPKYHIYIADRNDPSKLIDITQLIIEEMFPNASINANNFIVNIEGLKDSQKLRDILNFIYKRFLLPEDSNGFNPEEDISKVYDSTTKNILLKDMDGIIYLPITTAGNVLDKTGVSIQERLDNMTRLGFATACVRAETNNQSSFQFDYPFKDYPKHGNYVEVRIGSTYIDKARYEIIDNVSSNGTISSATINFIDETIEIGRAVNFLFIYNAKTTTGGKFENISGGFVANNSLPSTKLEKVSDSFLLNDSTCIASSKGLYNLFLQYANDSEDRGAHYYFDETEDDVLYYPDNRLNNGDIINIVSKVPKDLSKGMKLKDMIPDDDPIYYAYDAKTGQKINIVVKDVNGNTFELGSNGYEATEPIYVDILKFDGTKPTYILPAGKIIKLLYQNKHFFIITNTILETSRFIHTCIDQETVISFKELLYSYGNVINVYRNGVRLFEDLDYSINYYNETITLFVRTEEGERIVFESVHY